MSQSRTDTTAEPSEDEPTDESVLVRTHPTIRPTLVRLGVALAVGLALFALFRSTPGLLGSPDVTATASLVVVLLTLVLAIRYVVRIVVLRRTTYLVTDARVEREYALLFRTHSTGVRFDKLRSHELTQSRIQSLLGFGTVSLNRGLGPVRLTDVRDPEEVYDTIRRRVRRVE